LTNLIISTFRSYFSKNYSFVASAQKLIFKHPNSFETAGLPFNYRSFHCSNGSCDYFVATSEPARCYKGWLVESDFCL